MAKLYQTLLGLAAELKVEKWGRPEDWAILESVSQIAFPRRRGLWSQFEIFDSAGMDAGKKKDRRAYLELARSEFQSFMGYLIEVVNIRPRFSWKYDGWQLEWGTRHAGNLAAVLLLQLLPVMADVDGFAICSACHLSYIPPRRPDPTRNNYCERCGRAAAVRDAKRRQRAKEREERSNG
jgi:hypothetical protein